VARAGKDDFDAKRQLTGGGGCGKIGPVTEEHPGGRSRGESSRAARQQSGKTEETIAPHPMPRGSAPHSPLSGTRLVDFYAPGEGSLAL